MKYFSEILRFNDSRGKTIRFDKSVWFSYIFTYLANKARYISLLKYHKSSSVKAFTIVYEEIRKVYTYIHSKPINLFSINLI